MLSAPSQLLLRNRDTFASGKWLFANPADSQIFSELGECDVQGFHQYYDVYQACGSIAPEQHQFAAFYQGEPCFDGIVIYMPKAKAQLKMLVDNLQHYLTDGGVLMLVGENNSGVKSAAKLLASDGGKCNKIDSARHCSLFSHQQSSVSGTFDQAQWLSSHGVKVGDRELTVFSLPGVFSHGELDPATELLLNHLPERISGRTLDFGCGAGIIGGFIAKYHPHADVVMCDVSALALYCAEKTAEANQISVKIVPSDGLKAVQGKSKHVFTNPPFHTGIKTDYSVTENFLRQLPGYTQDSSQLHLVANSFIQYGPIMEKCLRQTNVKAHTTKFRLYHCYIN